MRKSRHEMERLVELARRHGTAIEFVLECKHARGATPTLRVDYSELDEALASGCERATILVHDPLASTRILTWTLSASEPEVLDREELDVAVRDALDSFARRFPGTLP